jgi:hypothetical protein
VGKSQFRTSEGDFRYVDTHGRKRRVALGPGDLAFTVGKVLVVAHSTGPPWIAVVLADGSIRSQEGLALDAGTSAEILSQTDRVRRLDVYLGVGA